MDIHFVICCSTLGWQVGFVSRKGAKAPKNKGRSATNRE